MYERLRAVDRIEDPLESTPTGLLTKLLADHRILRKPVPDPLPQQLRGRRIGNRNRRLIRLPLDRQVLPPEIPKCPVPRLAGNFYGKLQPFGDFSHASRPCWCY